MVKAYRNGQLQVNMIRSSIKLITNICFCRVLIEVSHGDFMLRFTYPLCTVRYVTFNV